MIQDIRLHGRISDRVEYYATVAGQDIVNRYFHETGEQPGGPFVRFFSSGNEFKITPDGVTYHASGGSFCEYMFGIDLPVKDLVKKDVLNRLVMFGAVSSPTDDRITFTNDVAGSENFGTVFLTGNAVSNYYFFVHSDHEMEPARRQEEILRAIGKRLKYTDKVGKSDDAALVRDIFTAVGEEKSVFFLIRLVDRCHEEYYRAFEGLYAKSRAVDEEGSSRLDDMARLHSIERYQQERIKIDVMYKHPDNKRIVDEYKAVLIDCAHKNEIDNLDMARLTRLRTLSLRNRIPPNLFDTLDELLLKGKKIKEVKEPEHIKEMRSIFEGLFLKGHDGGYVDSEDMVKLLRAKQQAIAGRDNTFEEILLETCRLIDERSMESGDMTLLESLGYIVTYFDRFDTTYASINRISFTEDAAVSEENIRSLLGNKRAFDGVVPGLFRELFINSALANRYMTTYGRRKASALFNGLYKIEEGDSSIKEVIEDLNSIISEERYYTAVYSFLKGRIKSFYSDLSDKESQDQFIAESWKEMLDKGLIPPDAPEKVFRDAVINIRKESFYLHNLLPVIIAGSNSKLRDDFLDNSGLDRFYVEDLEREYFEKNGISRMLLDRIRKEEHEEKTAW
jgi:uncharacterized protein (TIGR04442 family)